jgi:hypothetical protein
VGSGGVRTNLATEAVAERCLCDFQLVTRLQIHPELRARSEITGEPHGRINRNSAPAADDVVETSPWHFYRLAHGVDAELERLEEIAFEDFSRVDRSNIPFASRCHAVSPMVIDDFDVEGISVAPPEAYSPLIIDPDRVLTGAISFELFQSVPRNSAKFIEVEGCMKQDKLL